MADSRHFLPVTRRLVAGPPDERALDLFRRARVPKSPGYRVLKFYEAHGAVQTRRGRLERDPRRILTLQGGLRADRALPERAVGKGLPPLDASSTLDALGVRHAFGFQTAANLQAYFEPAGAHAIYLHGDSMTAARLTTEVSKALTTSRRATQQDPYDLYVDDLDRLDVVPGPKGPMTSPVQTLLDLAIHSRTAAHREFLFDLLQKQGVVRG